MIGTFAKIAKKVLYSSFYALDRILKRTPKMTVLCYHGIADSNNVFDISLEKFEAQIKELKKSGFNFISFAELENYLLSGTSLPEKSILFTFDDGYKNVLATEELTKQHKILPVVFLITNNKEIDQNQLKNSSELLSTEDLKHLESLGWTIGSHSDTHPDLVTLSSEKVLDELRTSKEYLEKVLQKNVLLFSFPKGSYNNSVLESVEKVGYKFSFTMDEGVISRDTNLLLIPRVGINNTMSLKDFMASFSPSVVTVRKITKYLLNLFLPSKELYEKHFI